MYTIRDEVDEEITMLLHEDAEFIKLSEEERKIILKKLNEMLHHTLYTLDDER